MDNSTVRNRIREALSLRNMRQVDLSEKTGIPKGNINNWISQRYQPKAVSLNKMARALDVNEFWLAGYNVPIERNINISNEKKSDELSQLMHPIIKDEELKDLIVSICTLNDDQRKTIASMVKELIKINSLH